MGYSEISKHLDPIRVSYILMILYFLSIPVLYFFGALFMITSRNVVAIIFLVLYAVEGIQIYPLILPQIMIPLFSVSLVKIFKNEIFFDLSWKERENLKVDTRMFKISVIVFIIGIIYQIIFYPNLNFPSSKSFSIQTYVRNLIIFFLGSNFFYFLTSTLLIAKDLNEEIKRRLSLAYGAFLLVSILVIISLYVFKVTKSIGFWSLFGSITLGLGLSNFLFYRVFRPL